MYKLCSDVASAVKICCAHVCNLASKLSVVDPYRSADLTDVLGVCCFPSYCLLTPLMSPKDTKLID